MSLSFLGQKSFHPSAPQNVKKLFQAEEKKANEEKRAEELKREHEQEETRRHARRLLDKDAPAEPPSSTSFMYALPPGLKEAQDRQKKANALALSKAADAKAAAEAFASSGGKGGRGDEPEVTKAERDGERFAILKNAPREGAYTNDLDVHHQPFGVHLRNVKCKACGEWGHQRGDRECRLRHEVSTADTEKKAVDDPLARVVGAEASGGVLRWAPKAATAEGVHGAFGKEESNQQFVAMIDEEDAAALAAAAGGGQQTATAADLDPAVMAMLSEKQQRKLLKLYQKEQGKDVGGADEHGDGGRKRKKEKKDKKDKHKHHHKKKHHKSASHRDERRERDDGSGSDSDSR